MSTKPQTTNPWWIWGLALGLLALAFYPTLAWLVATWLGDPYYSHGFLVPPVALVLAWRLHRCVPEEPSSLATSGFIPGALLAGVGLALHLLALTRRVYPLSAAAFVLVLAGLVLALARPRVLRRQLFPLALLGLMIPLPWLETLTPTLARTVAATAVGVTRTLGLAAVASGARIELPGTALVVGAPCSGLSSLAALVTLGAVYAFIVQGPVVARVALALLALPLALLANLLRIVLLLVIAYIAGAEVALRYFHNWSGLVLFLSATGLLILLGKGLGCRGLRSDL